MTTEEEWAAGATVRDWLVSVVNLRGPMLITEAVKIGRFAGYTERQVRDAVMGEADWEKAGRLQIGNGMKLELREVKR